MRSAAEVIIEHGVDISRCRIGAYGQGFYTATSPVGFSGDTVLRVAVRSVSPLVGEVSDIERLLDPLVLRLSGGTGELSPPVATAVRRILEDWGYDAIIVRDAGGDGIHYVVALHGASVKAIVP